MSLSNFVFLLNLKTTHLSELAFLKLKTLSLQNSPSYQTLKSKQTATRLTKIFTLKLRIYFNTFLSNINAMQISNKQKELDAFKANDKVYEAKVKSLRVLSRQWKEKKSQIMYKNKYFSANSGQTQKITEQKGAQEIFGVLKKILRKKYLTVFHLLKGNQRAKMIKLKTTFIANYLATKRISWLAFAMQNLKLKSLSQKQEKSNNEIYQLETKLNPTQLSEIQNLKQKQQKLEAALDIVLQQKYSIAQEVDNEINFIQTALQEKRDELSKLKQRKAILKEEQEEYEERTQNIELSREEIFSLIYKNFLTNLKLWQELTTTDQKPTLSLQKSVLLEWLQSSVIDFNLDKASFQEPELYQMASTLSDIIRQYQRLKTEGFPEDLDEAMQGWFTCFGVNLAPNSYEEFMCKNKFTYKMLNGVLEQNSEVMFGMLQGIQNNYQKFNHQDIEIIEQ